MTSALPTELLRDLLTMASWAPSGANAQPWRFEILAAEQNVRFWLDEKKAGALFLNPENLDQYLAIASAVENFCQAAARMGLTAVVRPFPDPAQASLLVAEVTLSGEPEGDWEGTRRFILSRKSNRKKYARHPLPPAIHSLVKSAQDTYPELGLFLLSEDRQALTHAAKAVFLGERVRTAKKIAHQQLYEQEFHLIGPGEPRPPTGLTPDVLELAFHEYHGVRLFRHWWIQKSLVAIGLDRMLSEYSYRQALNSGGLLVFMVPKKTPAHFFEVGRAFQQVWLGLAAHGLWASVLGAFPLLLHRMRIESHLFTSKECALLQQAEAKMQQATKTAGDCHPAIILRIGESQPPTAQSPRLDLDELLLGAK